MLIQKTFCKACFQDYMILSPWFKTMQRTVSGEVLLVTQVHRGKITLIMVFCSRCYCYFLAKLSAKLNYCHYPSAHETGFNLTDI